MGRLGSGGWGSGGWRNGGGVGSGGLGSGRLSGRLKGGMRYLMFCELVYWSRGFKKYLSGYNHNILCTKFL